MGQARPPKHKILQAVEEALFKKRVPNEKPSLPTGRYVYCPASEVFHEPRLLPVVQGKKRAFYRCACGANGFLGKFWQGDRHGYSFEQATALAKEHGVIVCGL